MNEFLIVAGIHALAVISPGPDLVMMLRSSLMYSRRIALWSAVGLGLGIALHVTYSLLGIALIISQSVLLFSIIKYLGAAYLIYIGVKSLRSQEVDTEQQVTEDRHEDISQLQAVKLGFLTNALNPKATVFFLALFTQVIDPQTATIMKFAYGLEMVIATIAWFSIVAIFMTQQRIQRKFMSVKHHIERIFGVVLIALGLKVATT